MNPVVVTMGRTLQSEDWGWVWRTATGLEGGQLGSTFQECRLHSKASSREAAVWSLSSVGP